MGTAPRQQRHPAMPDPERLVTRSFRLLKRLGMDDLKALETIIDVSWVVCQHLDYVAGSDKTWVRTVISVAEQRRAALAPSVTHRQETHHGDGRRSSTSRQNQDPAGTAQG